MISLTMRIEKSLITLPFRVSLMLNGVEAISIGGKNYTSSSNSILLPLNLSDEVWLQLMSGSLVENADRGRTGLTSFSGFRVGSITRDDIDADVKRKELEKKREEEILTQRHKLVYDPPKRTGINFGAVKDAGYGSPERKRFPSSTHWHSDTQFRFPKIAGMTVGTVSGPSLNSWTRIQDSGPGRIGITGEIVTIT